MVDSYACSNATRLIVFLDTGKWVNFYFNHFVSSEYDSEFHTKIDKFSFVFNISCCLLVFSLGNLKYILGAFFTKEFTASYKNKRPVGHIAHLRKQFKSINTYNERKSEQAHIPHAPTLLENAVYNEWQFQALGKGNWTKKGI